MRGFFGKSNKINENVPQEPKKEIKHYAEALIRYKAHTNIFETTLDDFSIESIENLEIIDNIKDSRNPHVIDGFQDPISKQLTRFPNENKHSIILFICNKSEITNIGDYFLNKRKDSYFVVKYHGTRYDLLYVDHTGNEMLTTSIKYKACKPIIYSHQCLIGCCNDVPMFYFKNKGSLKLVLNIKQENFK